MGYPLVGAVRMWSVDDRSAARCTAPNNFVNALLAWDSFAVRNADTIGWLFRLGRGAADPGSAELPGVPHLGSNPVALKWLAGHTIAGRKAAAGDGAIILEASDRAPTVRKGTRQTDPRALRSRERLRNALLRLVQRQHFSKITLRDISAEAGVSYPTVFNQYDSKEDLFQDIAREEISGLLAAFRNDILAPNWRPGAGMCNFLAQRRDLWRTLLTAGASDVMRSEFIRRGRELAGDRPALNHGFPFDVISGVIASGAFEIISWWFAQDPDYPAQMISDMLETLVIEPGLGLPPGHFTSRRKTL